MTLEEKREILKLIAENISVEVETEREYDYENTYNQIVVTITVHDPASDEIIDQKKSRCSYSVD